MRITVVAHGRVKPPYVEADAHYRKLLSRRQPIEVIEVRADRDLARRIGDTDHVVALDSGGRALDSRGWSEWLDQRRIAARDVKVVIGGAKGLTDELLARADERLSLGPQTMAHQLARVVVLEQLYRATKILAGEPYHY